MQYSFLLLALFVACSYAQFSAGTQQAIVDAHNKLRSSIAKGTYVAKGTKKQSGADMRKIKWCPVAAASAQKWANTCPRGHSTSADRAGMGENIYWVWSSGQLGPNDSYGVKASNSWEKEFQDYGWTSNTMDRATFNTGIGHATQMAWSKTYEIGCGVKNCGPDANYKNYNRLAIVCQYKIAGNMMGDQIYKTGATCSACPSGTKCESATGLCV